MSTLIKNMVEDLTLRRILQKHATTSALFFAVQWTSHGTCERGQWDR